LDEENLTKLKESLEKYQKRHITSIDLIKKGKKIIGEKFMDLFNNPRKIDIK